MKHYQGKRHCQAGSKTVTVYIRLSFTKYQVPGSMLLCKVYDGVQGLIRAQDSHLRAAGRAGLIQIIHGFSHGSVR